MLDGDGSITVQCSLLMLGPKAAGSYCLDSVASAGGHGHCLQSGTFKDYSAHLYSCRS